MVIPGISKIFAVPSSRLPAYIREIFLSGSGHWLFLDMREVDFEAEATASSESEQTQEGIYYKSVLSFTSGRAAVSPTENLSFIFWAADGTVYLIGSKEPPFPKIKVTEDRSTPREGKAGYRFSVEWAGPLIPIEGIKPSF